MDTSVIDVSSYTRYTYLVGQELNFPLLYEQSLIISAKVRTLE